MQASIANWEEHWVVEARKALTEVAALTADKIINVEKFVDPDKKDFLGKYLCN